MWLHLQYKRFILLSLKGVLRNGHEVGDENVKMVGEARLNHPSLDELMYMRNLIRETMTLSVKLCN